MADPKSVREKMSSVLITGFKCHTCGVETVTHDGTSPPACLNCGTASPKAMWKNLVKTTSVVEILEI